MTAMRSLWSYCGSATCLEAGGRPTSQSMQKQATEFGMVLSPASPWPWAKRPPSPACEWRGSKDQKPFCWRVRLLPHLPAWELPAWRLALHSVRSAAITAPHLPPLSLSLLGDTWRPLQPGAGHAGRTASGPGAALQPWVLSQEEPLSSARPPPSCPGALPAGCVPGTREGNS